MKLVKLLTVLFAVHLVLVLICVPKLSAVHAAEPEPTNLALGKTVYFSSDEGVSTQGKDTRAVNAVDGDRNTWWTAQTKNASGDWDAQYPEWLCVDLVASTTLPELI